MIELVENQQDLAKWVKGIDGKLDIAVAFWGHDAVDLLALDRDSLHLRILLDLAAGGSNPDEVERLCGLGHAEVKQFPRLHAKAYLTSDRLLIGSANASSAGLAAEGAEAKHWTELALSTDDPSALQAAQAWFNRLWEQGRKIHPVDIENARAKWKLNRARRGVRAADNKGLLEAAVADPEAFRDLEIHVVVSTEDLSTEGKKRVDEESSKRGREMYAFEDWPDIPQDAVLICFTYDDEHGFDADKPMVYITERLRRRSKMKWVDPASPDCMVEGLRVERVTTWKARLESAKHQHKATWRKDGGMCQSLYEFVTTTSDGAGPGVSR